MGPKCVMQFELIFKYPFSKVLCMYNLIPSLYLLVTLPQFPCSDNSPAAPYSSDLNLYFAVFVYFSLLFLIKTFLFGRSLTWIWVQNMTQS